MWAKDFMGVNVQNELKCRIRFLGIYIALNKFACLYAQYRELEVEIQFSSINIYSAPRWKSSVLGTIICKNTSPLEAQSPLGKSGMWITIKGNEYDTKCSISVTINELFNIYNPQFPHEQNKGSNRTSFRLLLWEQNKIMSIKLLT